MNNLLNRQVFKKYLIKVKKLRQFQSSQEIARGLFDDVKILDYGSKLKPDPPIKYLSNKVKFLSALTNKPKILVAGDGIGRLARNIALSFPGCEITEIDLSSAMVKQANLLAQKQKLNNFVAVTGDALTTSYSDKCFDYSINYGLVRYLGVKDGVKLVQEGSRLSKYGMTISDGKHYLNDNRVLELYNKLNDIGIDSKLNIIKMNMYNMSDFYILYKMYQSDTNFRELVNTYTLHIASYTDTLASIAGLSPGYLYILDLKI